MEGLSDDLGAVNTECEGIPAKILQLCLHGLLELLEEQGRGRQEGQKPGLGPVHTDSGVLAEMPAQTLFGMDNF